MPNEIADMVRYYKELGAQKSDIEKEYKKLSEEIKKVMTESEVREGIAGEYIVKMKLATSARLDKNKIPEDIRESATTYSNYKRLYVSRHN